jgi:hypothetical protein
MPTLDHSAESEVGSSKDLMDEVTSSFGNPVASVTENNTLRRQQQQEEDGRSRVAAPLDWFRGGLWEKLDSPCVVWSIHLLLTVAMPLIVAYWTWLGGLSGWEVYGGFFAGAIVFLWSLNPAFVALRNAVRPDTGSYARLAAASADGSHQPPTITEGAHRSLRRWKRSAHITAVIWMAVVVVAMVPAVFMQVASGNIGNAAAFSLFIVCLGVAGPLIAVWYISLRLACSLASDDVARSSPRLNAALCEDTEWASTVRPLAISIADKTMPALSEWGTSLGSLAVGLSAQALAWVHMGLASNSNSMVPVVVVLLAIIPSLALVPATVSTDCENFIDSLNELRKYSDAAGQSRIFDLETYLRGCNRQQGVGFKVFGALINRQQLQVIAAKTYAVCVAAWFLFGPSVTDTIDLNDIDSLCNEGWAYADGSCFKAFGVKFEIEAGGTHGMAEWKTWPHAEQSCQDFGGHLATIESRKHHETTVALSKHLGVWIGLSDRIEEGSFVWSEGEPMAYETWDVNEPDDGKGPGSTLSGMCEGGSEDCVMLWHAGTKVTWRDTGCSSSQTVFNSVASLHSKQSSPHNRGDRHATCKELLLPYICSKPAIPGA